ncbi:hypothetical protein [Paenibacillus rigui]|uniref:Uncharacterized protein n=1 Tax=Paenibacillus rigui TaxID=554312 RepID=A0A229UJY8_9BACL|nr:hypothetical protein [Paenibacillus rigui]OXM83691.1 hypothetical protein CF651_24135 [Paenibacillus rigui]
MFLKHEAFFDYIDLTELSLEYGYITIFELIQRYKTAVTLIDKDNPLRNMIIRRLTYHGVDLKSLDKEFEFDELDRSSSEQKGLEQEGTEQEGLAQVGLKKKDNDKLDLIRASGKYKWNFRAGDPDFFPSIPHGHNYMNINIKLDPYRGEVFDILHDKQLKSEDRKFIIQLWNDDEFRDVARKAINHYATNVNPGFAWRVPNYKRLPRKRRV